MHHLVNGAGQHGTFEVMKSFLRSMPEPLRLLPTWTCVVSPYISALSSPTRPARAMPSNSTRWECTPPRLIYGILTPGAISTVVGMGGHRETH